MSPSFSDLGVPADLVDALDRRGISAPFEVQAATIPDILAGRDVCGRAPTGIGQDPRVRHPAARADREGRTEEAARVGARTDP